ncbi:thioesterase II family protein [Mycolicibacterium stellerae]|uniref:thioesterase II family protein n=1 Tax=Mycolicibacterium stellerae TaxID=2358193 RepID=UPI001F482101|nr:alpha/beta fold hydrolase [Mycolicibacterium stellerae]
MTDTQNNNESSGVAHGIPGSPAPVGALYIFPHAGGSASSYAPFARAFSLDIKRIAVQYPGRTDRHDVPDIESIPALAADVYSMLSANNITQTPVAFFGHSMGGLIAFEVARKFEENGAPIAALFLSASPAPGHGGYDQLKGSDAELLKMVNEMTGAASQLVDGRFGETVLRTLRNYGAITGYECPPGTKVACPVYAYAAADDSAVSYESVAAWSEFTSSDFDIRTVAGDHFYVTHTVDELVGDIERRITNQVKGHG